MKNKNSACILPFYLLKFNEHIVDGEVGLAYMKSFEREARIRREGQTQEIIRLGRKFGKSEEEILALLQEELQISEEWAKELLEKYTL